MPSSSTSNRKTRQPRSQQKSVDTAPSRSSPRPYNYDSNLPPPPPPLPCRQQGLKDRVCSTESKLSDITASEEFVYSDTSDDADAYFFPQEIHHKSSNLLDNMGKSSVTLDEANTKGIDQHLLKNTLSGESAFRDMKKEGGKSYKIVRFPDDSQSDRKKNVKLAPNGGPNLGTLIAKVAHSFHKSTSPIQNVSKEKASAGHQRKTSQTVTEYPYSMMNLRDGQTSQYSALKDLGRSSLENSPLLTTSAKRANYGVYEEENCSLPTNGDDIRKVNEDSVLGSIGDSILQASRRQCSVIKNKNISATVAAYFLIDYENSRVATLPSSFGAITKKQLLMYKIYFSWQWRWFVNIAIAILFISHTQNPLVTAILNTCFIAVFAAEIHIRESMYGLDPREDTKHTDRKLVRPMKAFLFLLGLESWMWWGFVTDLDTSGSSHPLFTSFLKPLVFFYVSSKARETLEAILRISQIVARVLMIECLLILAFAAVACRMFGEQFDSFDTLQNSWLNLFKLSTTVNNPSLWMPIYATTPSYSIFFVTFIIFSLFYYHSLVLSVVFQTYIQAVTEIHEQTTSDRDDAIRLAFLALLKDGQSDYIKVTSVRKCLQKVRPHYNFLKMNALLKIVDPSNEHIIDYPTFRNTIRRALNSSVRTARTATPLAMGVEFIAVLIAGANFIFATREIRERFRYHFFVGSAITLLGLTEVIIRINPLKIQNFSPITRLNIFFDGSALIAAIISCVGIVQFAAGYADYIQSGEMLDFLHLGRAIDMMRVLRFFPIFRDIVRRSSDVLPAMGGPLLLVITVIHLFVCAGMVIWGGAIDVENLMKNPQLTPLYCLNNFNSYTEGFITMFNIAVVNDWHAISDVYLFADRNSSTMIIYPFFIGAIFLMVFIMVNVIIAFFVESFVTKSTDTTDDNQGEEMVMRRKGKSFKIQNSENTNVRRVRGSDNLSSLSFFEEENEDYDDFTLDRSFNSTVNSTDSTATSAFAAFDIYEREGFDQIMRTVTGMSDGDQEAFAQSVCNYLERFESLTNGREKVGYMICCQQSMNRFGNRRFQTSARCYLTDDTLHKVVSDMHSELLVLTSNHKNNFGNRCLVRTFPQLIDDPSQHLEVAATLLRYQPAATLFVSRIRSNDASSGKRGEPMNQLI